MYFKHKKRKINGFTDNHSIIVPVKSVHLTELKKNDIFKKEMGRTKSLLKSSSYYQFKFDTKNNQSKVYCIINTWHSLHSSWGSDWKPCLCTYF